MVTSLDIPTIVTPVHSSLLEATQPATAQKLQEWTNVILDETTNPVGTLSEAILKTSMLVLNGWAKTSCPTGAMTAERILHRLEREADAGNGRLRLSIMHYAVVSVTTLPEFPITKSARSFHGTTFPHHFLTGY